MRCFVTRGSARSEVERPTHELDKKATEASENDEGDEVSERRRERRSDVVCSLVSEVE